MSNIVESIKSELIKRCDSYEQKTGYNYYEDHIRHVVKSVIELAKKYNADIEIVELGALLHDISVPSEYGTMEEHHIYGEKIAEELLTKLNYPQDRKELVKKCILNHRSSGKFRRETIEEQCVADGDVMAHFDCIPSLFSLVYKDRNMSIEEGKEYVKKKLERDYEKLSLMSKELLKDRYEMIMKVLFI